MIRAAALVLLLAGCAGPQPVPPPVVERQLPPAEWLLDCPVAWRTDRSNAALVEAYLTNLEALSQCNGDKRRLRTWSGGADE